MVQASPIEKYLAELATRLPASPGARDMLDEARDHLLEAAVVYEPTGASREVSERRAVQEFGTVEQLARDFRAVIVVRDAQRQARWQLTVVGLLGACGIAVFRLVPVWLGQLSDVLPPPLVAAVAAVVLLWPSLVLLTLSLTSRIWCEAGWIAGLANVRTAVSWLFAFGLPLCASMVTDQAAMLVGASHAWLLAGALGGCLVTRRVVPDLIPHR
jgi:HAAS